MSKCQSAFDCSAWNRTRWRLARHAIVAIAEATHMPVDGRCGQTVPPGTLRTPERACAIADATNRAAIDRDVEAFTRR